MSNQLFKAVQEGHDPRNRIVFIAVDAFGHFFVYKPHTGYKSEGFGDVNDPALQSAFQAQLGCAHLSVVSGNELEQVEDFSANTDPAA